MRIQWLWLIAVIFGLAYGAGAAPVRDKHVVAELVPAVERVVPGQAFQVGLRLTHDKHWHTYWINPGTGYATSIDWKLPEGWKAGEIEWPTPKLVTDRSGAPTGIGYEDTVVLPVTLTPPVDLAPGSRVRLAATAAWLMCEVTCIPGEVELTLELETAAAGTAVAPPHPRWGAVFAGLAEAAARPASGWELSASRSGGVATLTARRVDGAVAHVPGTLTFFARDGLIDYAAPQPMRTVEGGWQVELKVDPAAGDKARLVGEWVAAEGWEPGGRPKAILVDAVFGVTGGADVQAVRGLAAVLGLAFVGGLILNLMPCVFPVLGVKILGFVRQAGSDRRKVAVHGLIFAAGVLVSFWVLAGALLALRAGGEQLGWGFQLQDPRFVFALSLLLLLVALNLAGVFEIGLSAVGVGSDLTHQGGAWGTFFSGVLATVVATPCSAPFLAPALGTALSLPPVTSFVVFTFIALGLGAPYLVLSLFPDAVKVLPKPGAWMETFKQAMAFPMFATVAYLLWVLAAQLEDFGLLWAMLGMTLAALAVWIYGRFLGHATSGLKRAVCWGLFVAAGACAGWLGWPRTAAPEIVWQPWSAEAVAKLRSEGRPIYVDFTARWCATCQTNKQAVFSSREVLDTFRERRVATLRADWTNRDALITEELRRFNRSAIPFNLVYLPGEERPRELPELLTPGIVLDALGR